MSITTTTTSFKQILKELLLKCGLCILNGLIIKRMLALKRTKNFQNTLTIQSWKAQKEFQVDELGRLLEENLKDRVIENDQEFIDCGECFIRGKIICDNPLVSDIHNHQMVYQEISISSKITQVTEQKMQILEQIREPTVKTFVSLFQLQSAQPSMENQIQSLQGKQQPQPKKDLPYSCYIEDAQGAHIRSAVQYLGITTEDFLINDDSQNEFLAVFNVNRRNNRNTVKSKTLKSTTKSEKGIRVNEIITVRGKCMFNPKQRIIKIQSPSHILTSKREIESFLSNFGVNSGLCLSILSFLVCVSWFVDAIRRIISNKPNKPEIVVN